MALPSFRSSLPLLALLIAVLCAMLPPSLGATTSGTSRDDPLMLDRFHRWMTAHGRSYPSAAEKLHRFEVYRRNVELIDASNRDAERLGYELGENEFTDLTHDEFLARYTGGAVPAGDGAVGGRRSIITTLAGDVREGVSSDSAGEDPPQRWDWREHGAVTPAKHQGGCGCCWAFAAVATVESLNKIKGGELVDLSVQELVDCSMTSPFQSPCSSGYSEGALQWIKAKGGLLTEAEYPYTAKRGKCMSSDAAGHRVGKITGAKVLPPWDTERALALAVLESPVAVHIDASSPQFQSYKSGIFKGPCGTSTNHDVAVVGYGVDEAGVEYWIVKNSWGETWGEKGFGYIRKGADGIRGLCGIAIWGIYPLMD